MTTTQSADADLPPLLTEKDLLRIVDQLIRDVAFNRGAAVSIAMAVGAAVEAEVRNRFALAAPQAQGVAVPADEPVPVPSAADQMSAALDDAFRAGKEYMRRQLDGRDEQLRAERDAYREQYESLLRHAASGLAMLPSPPMILTIAAPSAPAAPAQDRLQWTEMRGIPEAAPLPQAPATDRIRALVEAVRDANAAAPQRLLTPRQEQAWEALMGEFDA